MKDCGECFARLCDILYRSALHATRLHIQKFIEFRVQMYYNVEGSDISGVKLIMIDIDNFSGI